MCGQRDIKRFFYFLGRCKYVCATLESQCWSKLNTKFSLFYSPFVSREEKCVHTRVPLQLYGLSVQFNSSNARLVPQLHLNEFNSLYSYNRSASSNFISSHHTEGIEKTFWTEAWDQIKRLSCSSLLRCNPSLPRLFHGFGLWCPLVLIKITLGSFIYIFYNTVQYMGVISLLLLPTENMERKNACGKGF